MSWVETSIDDVSVIVTKGTTPTTYGMPFTDHGVNFVKAEALNGDSSLDRSGFTHVSEETHDKLKRSQLEVDDVLVTIAGANVGKCGLVRAEHLPANTNQAVALIRVDQEKANPRFVYYHFKQPWMTSYCRSLGGQAAQPNVNLGNLKKFKVSLPNLPTQERIAAILSAYDDLIENNRRRIALLEQAARLLYREWFVHFRFPGHETANFIDGLPEGWERVKLGDVCTRITDGSHASPKSVDEGFPMASVKDMHDWGIETKSCRLINGDDFDKLVKTDCKPLLNDVLIAKDGSYLKHCFVIQKEIDLVILSSIAILRPNERIDPHYLSFTLRDPHVKERMKGYVSGAALPRIILREFRGFEITLPSEEVRIEWATCIHPIAKQCRSLVEQNEQLIKARDVLLPRLMDGRIPV